MLYFRLEGLSSNPMLVLVHSLGADHGMWDLQMPQMLRHYQILRMDLRGHGASQAIPGDYSIELLARDILDLIGKTRRERFSYCGLSLGGMIGQWMGAYASERIDGLVLANTSPHVPDPSVFGDRIRTVLDHGMSAIEPQVMSRCFSPHTLAAGNPTVESIRTVLLATNPVGYAGCCAAIRDMDLRPLLPRIKTPVLVIGGIQDISTPWFGNGDVLVNAIPRAQGVRLPAAHLSNVEEPSLFTTAMLDFFTSLPHS
jgi:3-oxoadipate enol-lactonase